MLTVTWSAVSHADLYQVQVIQPNSGPGGGALTVAARQVSGTTVTLPVPSGQANVIVAGCNGDGCGPNSGSVSINPAGPNPMVPNLGQPMAGTIVSGPVVVFSWSRIPADVGNTVYELYVQDLSRQAPAMVVYTKQNFYGAYFEAEGSRYDAIVIANPGPSPLQGPPNGFNVSGTSSTAPTMVQPGHQDTGLGNATAPGSLTKGNIQLGWTPVPGATLYEYYVAIQGQPNPTVLGLTPGLLVQAPLAAVNNQITLYTGITRACPAGNTCTLSSDAGWNPWSNVAGPGGTNFTITP
jgi:hypothetical protein